MRLLTLEVIAVPCLVAGCIGIASLRQPSQSVGAYSNGGSVIYAAQVLSGPERSAPSVPASPHIQAATPALPGPGTRGVAAPATSAHLHPGNSYAVKGAPSVSPALINQVLTNYGSPMAGEGQQLYDLGVKYGIDPAFCLAFFIHESAAGTRGEAVLTHNLGNIRSLPGAPALDGYRYYDTWLEGAEAWYKLISSLYVDGWGLNTVDQIIPVYAPSADSNDPAAYIADVEQLVSSWRSQSN